MNSRAKIKKYALSLLGTLMVLDVLKWAYLFQSLSFGAIFYSAVLLAPALFMSLSKNPIRGLGAASTMGAILVWQTYYLVSPEITGSGSGDAILAGILPLLYGIPFSMIVGFTIGSKYKVGTEDGAT